MSIHRQMIICERHRLVCDIIHKVLFIADEIQTGIARTGGLLAVCGNCTCEAAL